MLPTGADVATLIIVFQFMVLIVLTLAVTAAALYSLFALNRKIKEIMPMVQGRSRQLADKTESLSNKAASPFVSFEAGQARRKAERDHIISSLRRKKDATE